ncbi:MAG: LD-carboxypeptidase [Desulfobacteraceae bacterium]|nr:LD-carboxypeptidase [Desulfobacteraceae bacterium]MBC2755900.1 LD-carboxypeptidase [Desulfobacteraceae bacterium]
MSFDSIHKKKPARLFTGDTIGIIAPSSPFDKPKFRKGLSVLEEIGFTVFFPENIFEQKGYLAGSDAHRAKMLNSMFIDSAVKGIFCARGGYGALRILPLIDYDSISLNPKLFIGCSDITVLLNTFYSKCGLVSLHGPMIESLAEASDQTKQSLHDMLLKEQALTIVCENRVVIHSGLASGIMAGGNLTTLCHLVGTPFEPNFSDQILLLEDIGESPYRIDRLLIHMKMAGCFDHIAGLVLGSFKGCGEPDVVYQVFDDIFSNDCFPILAGFDIGHDEPNLTIPFGITASLDTANGKISYGEFSFCDS